MKHMFLIVFLFLSVFTGLSVWGNPVISDTTLTYHLTNYLRQQPIEKLYVHQDRTVYYPGDTIWLKVYQTLSSGAETASRIAYVDVANGNGDIIVQVKYPLIDGQAFGGISLPSGIPAGRYQLRAYTRWMQNFAPDGFFHREFIVYGETDTSKIKAVRAYQTEKNELNFFPEGGRLVEGLASKVAFEIRTTEVDTLLREGMILNDRGDTIQTFATSLQKKGSFFFQPRKGEHYVVRLRGCSQLFKLPEIQPEGFVVNVKHLPGVMRILLTQNLNAPNHTYTLVLHQEGQVFTQLSVDCSQPRIIFDLPVEKLPSGVFTLTLIDESYRVFCERLAFTRFPKMLNIDLQSKVLRQGGHRRLAVDVHVSDEEGTPQEGTFSLAITRSLLEKPTLRDNFEIYFFLISELRGSVEQPTAYWNSNDPECLSRIELLLLTQGWRRYSLEALNRSVGKLPYSMEQSLSLSGKIKDAVGKKKLPISVQAVLRQDSVQQLLTCSLDSAKNFALTDSFYGKKQALLSAIDQTGKTFPIALDTSSSTPPSTNYHSLPVVLDSKFNVEWEGMKPFMNSSGIDKQTFDLGEVKVTAHKRDKADSRRSYYGEGFVKTTMEIKEATSFGDVRHLLRSVTGVQMMPARMTSMPVAHLNGYPQGTSATFVLDGYVLGDSEIAYSMDASHIERVEVLLPTATMFGGFHSGGIIALYTRRPGEGIATDDNKLICEWIGYSQTKEFYVPSSTDTSFFEGKKQRNTLYWNPSITTDSNGEAHFSVYLNEKEQDSYVIHCEGHSRDGLIGAAACDIKIEKGGN